VDYERWTTDDLNTLSAMLAAEGAGPEEADAVAHELARRASLADQSAAAERVRSARDQLIPFDHSPVAAPRETNASRNAELEHVGVAPRFIAFAIDLGVFFLGGVVLAVMTGASSDQFDLLCALVFFGYYVSCETLMGATLGKLALGLRVVDENGDPISWGAAFVRNLMRILDGLFFYLVGAIAIWSSPARQRLGDRAAHTYVVRP